MKQLLLKIALFFSLLTIPVAVLLYIPYSKEFAYHFIEDDCYNHGAWIFDRIIHNPKPVDVAFIGSSHTIHAFQEKPMEELLGQNYQLANFGYCRYGRNLEYTLLKLLLNHKSPKIIVLEVHEDEVMNSHDIFPFLAETNDLLLTPTPVNRDYFSDLFDGISARLEGFKAKYIFKEIPREPNLDLYGYGASERMVTEEELIENKKAWTKRIAREIGSSKTIENIQLRYPLVYLEKMISLIKEKNIRFVFVYLPECKSMVKSPKHADLYHLTAPLLIPPPSILNDTTNWMDASHFNDKGSLLISAWMAEQLKNEFCKDGVK